MISKSQISDTSLRNTEHISKAKLKWFNAAKGFGFVVPEDNPVDAFLHITQLQKLGLHGLGDGAEVLCIIDRREKGAIVTDLVDVLFVGELHIGSFHSFASPDPNGLLGVDSELDAPNGFDAVG